MKTIKLRRKKNITDYGKRLKLLKSERPRIVVRLTNKYVISQYVKSDGVLDKTELRVNSKDLLKYGWPEEFKGSLKSLPAAYLTGYLIGTKLIKGKKEEPIADFGVGYAFWKTKKFAFLKGFIDSGVKIKHDEKTFPNEDRITGKNLKKDFSKHFEEVKNKIKNE